MANGDASDQLAIQQQINALLESRKNLLDQMEQSFSRQAAVSKEMCAAMEKCRETADRTTSSSERLRQGLEDATDQTEDLTDGLENAADNAEDASSAMNNASSGIGKIIKGGIGLLGIGSIFGKLSGMATGLFSALTSVAGAVLKIGFSILMLPLNIFSSIVQMAGGGGGGGSGLRQAMEDVREEFGNLATNEGGALIGTLGDMRKNMSNLAGTGLKMGKVFGYGKKGMAELLKANLELAKALGPSFNSLKDVIRKNSVAIAMYGRGLGLSAEAQAQMIKHSKAMGKDPVKYLNQVANQAIQLGKRFDISSKVMGKAIGEMTSDVDNFGHMSVKSLGATSAYAIKLGIDVKQLAGVVDKFLNFEDAAESVAALNQAFGAQVDVMKLMNAESPAKKIDMLRQAMFRAGKDVKSMTLAERKLLMQQTGLSGASFENAFAMEKQAVSYDEMAKASDKAADSQKSQAEVMKELGKNIKRLVRSGGGQGFNSFFDALKRGFASGVKRSAPFRRMLRNIRRALRYTYKAGRAMGKMFVNMFPGIKKMIDGLGDIFNPARFKGFMEKIKASFKTFMEDLAGNKPTSVKTFLANIKKAFMDWLSGGQEGGGKILKGLGEFWEAFTQIMEQALPLVLKGISWVFGKMAAFLEDPSAAGPIFDAIGNFFGNFFGRMYEAIEPHLGGVADSFMKLVQALEPYMTQIYEWISTKLADLGAYIWDQIISSTIGKIVIGVVAVLIGGKLIGALASAFGGIFSGLLSIFGGGSGGAQKFREMIEEIAQISLQGLGKAGLILAGIAIFLTLITHTVIIPMMEAMASTEGITLEKAGAFAALLAALMAATYAVLKMLPLMTPYTQGPLLKKAVIGFGLIGLLLLVIGGAFALSVKMVTSALGDVDAGAVASIFESLVSLITALMIMMPVAAVLGVAAMAAPFGTAGVALLVMGFGVLAGLLVSFVNDLVPAIKLIAEMNVGDPNAFSQKMTAIASLIESLGVITNMNDGFTKIEGANPEQITEMVKANTGGVTDVLKELRAFIIPFISAAAGLNASQIKSATRISKLLGELGGFINSLNEPMKGIIEAAAKVADDELEDFARTAPNLVRAMRIQTVELMKQIGQPISDMIKTVMNTQINVEGAEKMLPKFKMIASAAKVVTTASKGFFSFFKAAGGDKMMGAMMDNLSEIEKKQLASGAAGGRVSRGIVKKKAKIVVGVVKDMTDSIAKDLGPQMAGLLDSINKAYNTSVKGKFGPKEEAEIARKTEMIGSMFSVAGTFVDVLSKMKTTFGDTGAAETSILWGKDVDVLIHNMKVLAGATKDAITDNMPGLLDAVLDMANDPLLAKFANDQQAKKKLETLTSLFGIASTFTKMMSDIIKSFPKFEKDQDGKVNEQTNHLDLMGQIVSKMKTPMSDLIEHMVGTDGKGGILSKIPSSRIASRRAKNLKLIMEATKDIVSSITTLGGKDGAGKNKDYAAITAAASTALSDIYTMFDKKALKDSGATGITIPEFIQKLNSVKLPAVGKNKLTSVKSLETFVTDYAAIIPSVQIAAAVSKEQLAGGVVKIVDQINEMNTALTTLPAISVNAALVKFSKKAAAGSGTYDLAIKPANVKITVNVDVSLNKANFVKWLAGTGQTTGKNTSLQVHKK